MGKKALSRNNFAEQYIDNQEFILRMNISKRTAQFWRDKNWIAYFRIGNTMEKILMIITSHKELLNTKSTSGVWLGEFTDPYYELLDAGYQVDLASPLGGEPPVDPVSKLTEHITSTNRRFLSDQKAQH